MQAYCNCQKQIIGESVVNDTLIAREILGGSFQITVCNEGEISNV